jgi:Domain of unknown function (DUF4432)
MRWDLIASSSSRSANGQPKNLSSEVFDRGQRKSIDVQGGQFHVAFSRLVGGLGDGVDVVEIDTGCMRTVILPTRGMSLWKAWSQQTEIGWQSPVHGPVHPNLVPIFDPNGIGWLEGFDELVVRCGLQSNGAPDFDSRGTLRYPLHGRIGNLPADWLAIEIDREAGTLDVIGSVREARFHIQALKMEVRYRFRVKRSTIDCTDVVTNERSQPASMQMLYHINVGRPLLEKNAKIVAALAALAPRNPGAAKDIDRWDTYEGPTPGYSEQVYFAKPCADHRGWTTTVLHNANRSQGIALRFDTRTLPYLNLWKNTVAVEDGYVTGLEPATGFPNPRSFEEKQGRVVELAGGASRTFAWQLEALESSQAIVESLREVELLQRSPCKIHRDPKSDWSAP